MSSLDRYTDALAYLRDAHKAAVMSGLLLTVDQNIALAQVNATLATAAVLALQVVTPYVGDSEEISNWAKFVAPDALASRKSESVEEPTRPEFWPPKYGDIWRDRRLCRWAARPDGLLVSLGDFGGNFAGETLPADEVELTCGPLTRVSTTPEAEVAF